MDIDTINRLLIPVNKMAALLVNQRNCDDVHLYTKVMQAYDDTKKAIVALEKLAFLEEDKKKKKELNLKKRAFELNINNLSNYIKEYQYTIETTLNSLIIKECRNYFNDKEWECILADAKSRLDAGEKKNLPSKNK